MTPNKLKALLVEREISQVAIAQALGLARSSVCRVVNGHSTSKRIRKYIANLLDMDQKKLFGKNA